MISSVKEIMEKEDDLKPDGFKLYQDDIEVHARKHKAFISRKFIDLILLKNYIEKNKGKDNRINVKSLLERLE